MTPARIYYFGQSLGGIDGTLFLAVEPNVYAGVPECGRWVVRRASAVFPLSVALWWELALAPACRRLINIGGIEFDENLPLRDQPPVINTVPGAIAIQEVFEWAEWIQQAGDAVAYSPHLRKQPLAGVPAKSVIIQFAKGDQSSAESHQHGHAPGGQSGCIAPRIIGMIWRLRIRYETRPE